MENAEMNYSRLLQAILDIAEEMLVAGAEVSRVEDTIRRVALAYGAERVDVFSITSSIVSTLYFNCDQCVTQTRRVSSSGRRNPHADSQDYQK